MDVTFMVSHSHGVEKQVSFGAITKTETHGVLSEAVLQNSYLEVYRAAQFGVPESGGASSASPQKPEPVVLPAPQEPEEEVPQAPMRESTQRKNRRKREWMQNEFDRRAK